MSEQACRECHRIFDRKERTTCVCGSSSLSNDWSGFVVIIDAKRSKIAEKLNITLPGHYALKVR
ncbi:DNA-directed RNA polymerase subunit E'' [Methanosarcinales archaeon]|uniref:Transcription elongation factor Spt4 n=1 Tax=Candidatus Syntropharchaeum caldarium TaxID=1838285 RepID=A0A1F2PAY8_9EURY|nr:MAG: DNA-directed RNA polymerase subunit E' [Candidatus Syntrophoarchaeum caldarius]RLG35956.1 MAG: DNA-directed RNA polymerase subunit E'' [Methanosarcinales archaeon]